MRSRQSDKSDAVFLLFPTSRPPTSFLSSLLAVHTVFPTYALCSVCYTYAVTHTHRPQCSTHHNCSTLGSFFFFLFSEKIAASDISQQPVTHLLVLPETKLQVIADGNFRSLRHASAPHLFLEVTPSFSDSRRWERCVRFSTWTGAAMRVYFHRQKQRWESRWTHGRVAFEETW